MCGYRYVFVCTACTVMLCVAIAVSLFVQRVQKCYVWLQLFVCVCRACAVILCLATAVCLCVQRVR